MDFHYEQKKFDDIKWYDSILAGADRCGSYEFCGECNKAEVDPCARAAYRYREPYAPIEEACGQEKRELVHLAKIRVRLKKKVEV